MKAVLAHEFGGPEVLKVEDIDKPIPHENEILIEVHASSLNPVDAKSLEENSRYKDKIHFPVIPGMDIAGVVEMVGEGVNNIQKGDKVFGQAGVLRNGSGAFAEYAVTSEDAIALIPSNINFAEAAALPLAAASAYQALVEYMNLQRGQKLLIHGGSGGIGSFAIQLAKHLGAYVVSTASGEGIEFVKHQGADEVIDYKNGDFTSLRDFDAVLDTIGGDTYKKSFGILKKGGIIVSMLSKPDEELMEKYQVKAILEMTRMDRKVLWVIARLVEEGVFKVNIAKKFSLDETPKAYRAKDEEKILGKIVIEVEHQE
ncbi:NADP-dependent oxidoreductase [Chryseosolibacter indicus]|uniref:NADP-dependent oxidoreductase n=1 Tax=Chryseosolibacter indicus TaxID=2782351 RepID=A0ABS5VK30_9BACT|nr:NADP-dependent oxidoreductase [Chryseosolibacter indicus]MBT1701799.1 NADP-dependent oxidoreductase [Chryseosolibacter indicus]